MCIDEKERTDSIRNRRGPKCRHYKEEKLKSVYLHEQLLYSTACENMLISINMMTRSTLVSQVEIERMSGFLEEKCVHPVSMEHCLVMGMMLVLTSCQE